MKNVIHVLDRIEICPSCPWRRIAWPLQAGPRSPRPDDGSCRRDYLIDTDNAIILEVEATRAIRQAEVGAHQADLQRRAGDGLV
jgi:hypothetical protein